MAREGAGGQRAAECGALLLLPALASAPAALDLLLLSPSLLGRLPCECDGGHMLAAAAALWAGMPVVCGREGGGEHGGMMWKGAHSWVTTITTEAMAIVAPHADVDLRLEEYSAWVIDSSL